MKFILVALSGLLLGIPFVYPDFALLVWLGLIPYLFAVEDVSKKKAFFLGWLMGILFFALNGYWLIYPLVGHSGFPFGVNLFFLFLAVAFLGLFLGCFSLLFKAVLKKNNFSLILIVPVLWTGIEFIRTLLPIQYYFGFLGYSQSFIPQLVQLAHFGGVYIVSFIIVLFNVLIYLAIKKNSLKYSLVAILIIGLIFSYGHWEVNRDFEVLKQLNISVIQPNIAQEIKMSAQHQAEVRERIFNLSEAEIERSQPELLVWPETAILRTYDLDSSFPYLKDDSTPLFIGGFLQDEGQTLNSSLLVNSENDIIQFYSKMKLVPFGEYTPFSNLMPDFLGSVMNSLNPGVNKSSFNFADLSWSSPICSEILNPFFVRKLYDNNDFMITISNEAWFQDSNLPIQMMQATVLRAVENRSPIIKSGNTGISGVVDQNGVINKATQPFVEDSLNFDLKIRRDPRGLYHAFGDSFGFAILFVMAILVLFILIKKT